MNVAHLQAESYFKTLRNLSPDVKLELITKLSKSMRKDMELANNAGLKDKSQIEKNNMIDELFGSWESEKNAEEIIDEVKQARTLNSERVEL